MELWAEITWDKEACIRCQVMAVMAVTIKTEVTIILPWWVGIMVGFDHWARGSVNTRTSFITEEHTMLSWGQLIVRAYQFFEQLIVVFMRSSGSPCCKVDISWWGRVEWHGCELGRHWAQVAEPAK